MRVRIAYHGQNKHPFYICYLKTKGTTTNRLARAENFTSEYAFKLASKWLEELKGFASVNVIP